MDGLIYIYMLTITIEFILSLLLGVIVLAVIAPLGSHAPAEPGTGPREARPGPRSLSPDIQVALRDAFDALSRGGEDLAPLVHARHLLVKYQSSCTDAGSSQPGE